MTDRPTYEFVVLAYVSDPMRQDFLPVAVAGRQLGSNTTGTLALHVAAVLRNIVSKGHLDYLDDLFASWRDVSGDQLDSLFRELRELSSGPLRTQETGFCSIEDFPRIADRALRVDGKRRESDFR